MREGEHLTGQAHADRNSYPDASSPDAVDAEWSHPKERAVPTVPGSWRPAFTRSARSSETTA
jgi:hypothetical protein